MFKLVFIFTLCHTFAFSQPIPKTTGTLKISFINVVEKAPLILRDANYINPFGETYTVTKFKYYVSNIIIGSPPNSFSEMNSYHLINQEDRSSQTFFFSMPTGVYNSLSFLLGVDSLHNVSGAQTDALDPANDMFWTWNSGYIMAKLEGTSASSSFDKIFEFHIGGFSGANKVLQKIYLKLASNPLVINENKTSEIVINCDVNKWWQGVSDIKISTTPNITSMGLLAKKISDNYSKMFSLKEIYNY